MKKSRSFICIALLSTVLAGNVFAGSSLSGSVYSFFGDIITAVVEFASTDSCPLRQCQNCRPTHRDENGNCRPRED